MITLSKSGNSVTFTFENNGHYLANGTIDVPVNSLILVTDDSEMVSFKKLDGDPFISCLYSDLGMTKAQLISWYEANMVGSTGISEEEVESMISAATADMATQTWVGDQGFIDSNYLVTNHYVDDLQMNNAISAATTDFFDGVEYDSDDKAIYFYNGEDIKATIDASDFVIDGMVDNVEIQTISGASYLVIEFNTASGKEDIQIPVTSFFDASQYYTKAEVDAALSGKADTSAVTASISAATNDMATQTWVGQQGYLTSTALNGYATEQYVSGAVSGKADTSAVTAVSNRLNEVDEVAARALVDLDERKADTSAVTASINAAVSGKQDTLIAGSGITIDSANTISCTVTGGGKAVSAGTNISVTTGETADTVNCTLPISVGTGNSILLWNDNTNNIYNTSRRCFIIGSQNGKYNSIKSNNPFIVGEWNEANANSTFIFWSFLYSQRT